MEYNFPTTGNKEQDETEAARINRSMHLRDLGLCPNDESELIRVDETTLKCRVCGFEEHRLTLNVRTLNDESTDGIDS